MAEIDTLRDKLINRLFKINDNEILLAIDTLLKKAEDSEKVYQLSESQISELKESEEQIKNGQTVPHEEVMEKAHAWLRKK